MLIAIMIFSLFLSVCLSSRFLSSKPCILLHFSLTSGHSSQDLMTCLNFGESETPTSFEEGFEDNNFAYLLATNHYLTEISKWLNAKFHHFWERVNAGWAKVFPVASGHQKSDYLTKDLTAELFENNHKSIQVGTM